MELINKYQLKQDIWFMHDNKPMMGTIQGIYLTKSNELVYTMFYKEGLKFERTEDKLFSTKEDLLKSF